MNKDQKLYVVALPIGNFEDLTERARLVLGRADLIAAEDTRVFKEFCAKNKISTQKVVSHHNHNEKESAKELLQMLQNGKSVALVSDAGTPNISDPGHNLIKLCYEHNIDVVGIPGASSVTYALSVCPIGGKTHYFGGFAPESSNDRIKEFKEKCFIADRIVYFESPHRLIAHLKDAEKVFFGKCLVLRELTKPYEEILFKEIPELILHFEKIKPLGEFVIIYPKQEAPALSLEELKDEVSDLIRNNLKPADILKKVQDLTQLTRREVYDMITEIKHGLKKDE